LSLSFNKQLKTYFFDFKKPIDYFLDSLKKEFEEETNNPMKHEEFGLLTWLDSEIKNCFHITTGVNRNLDKQNGQIIGKLISGYENLENIMN